MVKIECRDKLFGINRMAIASDYGDRDLKDLFREQKDLLRDRQDFFNSRKDLVRHDDHGCDDRKDLLNGKYHGRRY